MVKLRSLERTLTATAAQSVAVLLAVLLLTRFGGAFTLPPSGISAFWPANAVLFAGLWLMGGQRARVTLLLALPTYFLAEVWIGYAAANAAVYAVANVAEVGALLWLLRFAALRELAFDNLRSMFLFLLLACLASPVGGGIGAMTAQTGSDFATVFVQWTLADFFGYCLCVPLMLSWRAWRHYFAPQQHARVAELTALFTVLASTVALASGALGSSIPLGAQFLPLPVLLWAALRFGPPGGALATLVVAGFAFFSATHGTGMFVAGSPATNVVSLQVFFASLVVSVMTIASLNAERRQSFEALRTEMAERAHAAEALRQSEARYRRLITTANEGIWVLDAEGDTLYVNARMAQMLGYAADEIAGRPFTDFVVDEELADHRQRMEARRRGAAESYERRFACKNGGTLWGLVSAVPIMDETHRFDGSFGMVTDITERKRIEQELMLVSYALDNVREAAFLIDAQANFRFVNEGACQVLGYTRDELLRMHVRDVDPDFPEERWAEHWRELQERRSLLFEGRHRTKQGRLVAVEISANYFEYGREHYNLALVRDITERKRTEEELRRYKDRLEETVRQRTAELLLARDAAEAANKAKSVFLANMSHELRTPLNAILGFSTIMRSSPQLSESLREDLEIINRSGEHLLTLINDVLEMAKIEAGRMQLERVPFDLGAMVRDVTELMEMRAREKGLRLLLDQTSEFPRYIVGDEARVRQVLINLVSNAIKFTQEGGVTVRLGVKADAPARLLIEVEDTGIGISPEDQQRIFQAFIQLGDQRDNKGTGLGLTITRQFVEMMGGTIGLESTLGKGSLFRVELPLTLAAESDLTRGRVSAPDNVIGLEPGQPEFRILIVEDQLENRLLLEMLLESAGFRVAAAENGAEGVDAFLQWHPHLIFMDRKMPVMDGLEATRRIRALPGGREVKIVAVTASAFQEQRAEMLAVGMDDFVRKPFRFAEIFDALSRHLGAKFRREEMTVSHAPMPVTPEMLATLPPELRAKLRTSLECLQTGAIEEAIRDIEHRDHELAKRLTRIAGDFDYQSILDALGN